MRFRELLAKFINALGLKNYRYKCEIEFNEGYECNISNLRDKLTARLTERLRNVVIKKKGKLLSIKATGQGEYNDDTLNYAIGIIREIIGGNNIKWIRYWAIL
jgi:hypothetical protein